MPYAKKIAPFFIIVTDKDQKIFNVLGPMTDDTEIIDRVLQCQNRGRTVNCHKPGVGQSREQIIASYSQQFGFDYSDRPIAV